MRGINPDSLENHAYKLDLRHSVGRLLIIFVREEEGLMAYPGRYALLEKVVQERSELFDALLSDETDRIAAQWLLAMEENAGNLDLLHILAVIYRERMLAGISNGNPDGGFCALATGLWGLLLASEEFWNHFCASRAMPEKASLAGEKRDMLMDEALESVLTIHCTLGSRNYAVGAYEQAYMHLHCLDLCRSGEDALRSSLEGAPFSCGLEPDGGRMERIKRHAEKMIDDWCITLLRDAEKATLDSEAIRKLQKGIRKNYEGGILLIEPFIKMTIPVTRVLHTCLAWYNDWCYDLYVTRDLERIKTLMHPAEYVADRLSPLCIQGRGHMPENQSLSQHFLLRGYTADDPEKAKRNYEEALAWNPANHNAQTLLGDAVQELLMRQLQTAMACMERKQFSEAYEVLDSIEEQASDKEEISKIRAIVNFCHAKALAEEGKFREALVRAREANRLEPGQEVIAGMVAEMAELAPEEDNLRFLRDAKREFESERFGSTIEATKKVSRDSKYYSQAANLLSAAYFCRGIDWARNQRLDDSISDLKLALEFNKNYEERKVISEQLKIIEKSQFGYKLKQALDKQNWEQAASLLRTALSRENGLEEKKELQSQLSFILNAHAVSLANEAQEMEKEFEKALVDIIGRVKSRLGVY